MKKLIIFDLDGTLAESKSAIDQEMGDLFSRLLEVAQVAIISGGAWPQFEKQVLDHLPANYLTKKLSILPTCGTKYYQYQNGWKQLYAENFTETERKKIIANLKEAVEKSGLDIKKTWGEQIEDRGSQITFSALGQQAPLKEKKDWDNDFAKRKKVKVLLDKSLKDFSITMGGATSIDITKPGIDKAYGIHKLQEVLGIKIDDMLFIGDALFEGGNDHPARKTGVTCIQVRDPEETKRVIETIIACLNK
ncbi:MAG: HAD-IIB family hydrolase [Bacteroidetes bacterium]|nr:HAD-IIB family hydrolase [Bacteroidota bacterium]MBU1372296.1 HAD-IIB family hydrolase [Bacteroidota bacterium]MBU1486059.1 HAD-IIB family hydrolase [Bacteroidota bacterium]MBU1760504.1 HAD-IIB family hydrolase [Bacteroidota bacterium]MBU2047124.1 HAD-IIB family hydrolase [Bacteroidota bacterium]